MPFRKIIDFVNTKIYLELFIIFYLSFPFVKIDRKKRTNIFDFDKISIKLIRKKKYIIKCYGIYVKAKYVNAHIFIV